MKLQVAFINSGTQIDEGSFLVTCKEPFLWSGMPAILVESPFGLGGWLTAYYVNNKWVCDLD